MKIPIIYLGKLGQEVFNRHGKWTAGETKLIPDNCIHELNDGNFVFNREAIVEVFDKVRDDKQQAAHFDERADDVSPHRLANAVEIDERLKSEEQQRDDVPRPTLHGFGRSGGGQAEQRLREDVGRSGHRGDAGESHHQADQV